MSSWLCQILVLGRRRHTIELKKLVARSIALHFYAVDVSINAAGQRIEFTISRINTEFASIVVVSVWIYTDYGGFASIFASFLWSRNKKAADDFFVCPLTTLVWGKYHGRGRDYAA